MKLKFCTALLTVATIVAPLSVMAEEAQNPAAAKRAAVAMYGKLPLNFEPTESSARFLAHSGNYEVSVGAHESSVAVTDAKSRKHHTLHFSFENANPAAPLEATEQQPGVTNYYLGRDASQWRIGVKSYGKVRAQSVYPGVDVVYYGDHRRLEFDFVVAPKADPGVIALSFSGMEKLSKDGSGDLVAEVGGQSVRFAKPYAYQKVNGTSKAVAADYEISANGKVHLHLGDYDRSAALIVDPIVSYATFLGGSSGDIATAIAVDSTGAAYVTGQTCSSTTFPDSPNPSGLTFASDSACDAYVTKFNPAGTALDYTTILGGSTPVNATASGNGIALDSANPPNVYIVGTTNMYDLPSAANGYQGGDSDAFIAILSSAGSLLRSTYLGGSGPDAGYGISVDTSGNVIVVGQTCSGPGSLTPFPFYNAFETMVEDCVAFVTKLDNGLDIGYPYNPPGYIGASARSPGPPNAGGKTYYFSEPYGGQPVAPYPTAGTWGPGINYAAGAIVLDTESTPHVQIAQNSGTSGPYLPSDLPPVPNWSSNMLGATLDGPLNSDPKTGVPIPGSFSAPPISWQDYGAPAALPVAFTEAYGVTIDRTSDIIFAGGTNSGALASIYWPCHASAGPGAWVLKIYGNGSGCAYQWTMESTATDITGKIDTARAVAVDANGYAYVTGTASGTLVGTNGNSYQAAKSGTANAFVFSLNQLGSAVNYSTFLGGSGQDQGLGIAVDADFSAYVTGGTKSLDFPTINPLTNPNTGNPIPLNGIESAFVSKFTPDGSALIFSSYMGGSEADQGNAIAVAPNSDLNPLDLTNFNMYVAGNTTSPDLESTLNCVAPVPPATPLCSVTYTPPQETNEGNGDAFVAMIPGAGIATSTVMPGSLAFANVNVGNTSTPQTVTYRNTNSNSTVQINPTAGIVFSNPEFKQIPGSGTPPDCASGLIVAASSTCQILVDFTPSSLSLQIGTLTIRDDASSTAHVVNLSGEGAVPTDSFSPSNLTFPLAPLTGQGIYTASAAQSVVLTNTSSTGTLLITGTAITGTNAADFSLTSVAATPTTPGPCQQELPPSNPSATPPVVSQCTISVIFTPAAAGPRNATVMVTTNASVNPQPINLSGTGALVQSTVTTSPASNPLKLTFPQQGMNVASTPQTVTVTNIDPTQSLVVNLPVITGAYQVSSDTCTTALPPAGTCAIQVVFYPTLPGTSNGTLTISGNGTTMPSTIILSGNAGANATLCAGPCVIPPNPLTFTGTNTGATSPAMAVTLTNQSSFAFSVQNVAISGPAASEFSQTNSCGTSVSATLVPANPATCTISVSFKPTATGNQNATLTVTSDAANSPQTVSIVGVGTASSVTFTMPPNPAPVVNLNFGNYPLSTPSAPQQITLTNSGTGPLNIPLGGITLAGTVPGDFSQNNSCGTQVAAGGTCTINVTFTPSARYSRSATLNIADDAPLSPQAITLVGAGVPMLAPTANLPSLSFTNQALNTASPAQLLTITNSYAAYSLSLGTPVATGDFQVAPQAGPTGCGSSLVGGGSCVLLVTFTPTASGTRTGTLSLPNSGSATPLTVPLTGIGGAAAWVQPTPPPSPSLNLGTINVGGHTAAQLVTLINSSPFVVNIPVGGVSMSGASASQFSYINNCGTVVPASGSCTLSVTFNPTATATQTATLNIAGDAQWAFSPVSLTGFGTSPAVSLVPLSLTFQNQVLNIASTPVTITLNNTGTGALNISGSSPIAISGAAMGDFTQNNNCGLQVAALGSCTINVTFTPTALNGRIATLTITDDASNSPQTVPLSGTGVQGFSLSPTSLNFSSVQIGTTSPVQTLKLTNNSSTSTLTINPIAFPVPGATDFSGTTNCPASPATLPASGFCTISVYFTPSVAATETPTLTITGNGASLTVALSGTGTTVATSAPPFSVTPGSAGVSITEGGTATYTFSVAPVSGFIGKVDFTCSGPKGSSCSISPNPLTMDGTTTKTATLSVNTSGGNGVTANSRVGARSIFLALLPFSMMGMLLINKRRGGWLVFLLLLTLCLSLGMVGCGSGTASTSSSGALAPGSYNVTVNATANGTTLSPINLSLVVNPQ